MKKYIAILTRDGKINLEELLTILDSNIHVFNCEVIDSIIKIESSNFEQDLINDLILTFASDNYLDLTVWITSNEKIFTTCFKDLEKTNIAGTRVIESEEFFLELIKEDERNILESTYLNLLNENLVETAKVFIKNNLNASRASNDLFIHRNTLTLRLDKIKSITDLDIRNFTAAFIIYTAIILANN